MSVQIQRRLFTVETYHQMAAGGALREDERLELIEGEIIQMSPIKPRHAGHVKRLAGMLSARLGPRAILGVQDPVELSDSSEPQPDISVLQPRADTYADSHPKPADILLIIEVADTTASYDRDVKLPLYARAGIREAWLVSLQDGWIEVHSDPSEHGYKSIRRAFSGETVCPGVLPDVAIDVADVLR